ncbi:MAG: aminoglycoside phosphotransferase family protein [Actinomycetota bacterium]|nr:aminoglycoside phosphotransferase family protein [Actinomycetota bacterium]
MPGGPEWLDRLPGIVEELAERWSLDLEEPIETGHSLVIPAGEAVLKINPLDEESEQEAHALDRWNGVGAARLLERDDELRALLVERLRPGTQLWTRSDDEATEIAAGVLERLWVPAAEPFRRLEDLAARWVDELPAMSIERGLVDEAVSFLREAGPTQRESVLLHQDFHGGNVLLSDRGWLAIDAKPVVGEREFDVASLIRDRRPTKRAAMERRLAYLVERLDLDPDRTRGWAIAHALAWSGSSAMVECARFLSRGPGRT